jgi:hypothetical protein
VVKGHKVNRYIVYVSNRDFSDKIKSPLNNLEIEGERGDIKNG